MANDKTTAPQVDFSRLPRHVAIILDGNGRWAKKRGLPRTAGHAYGAEAFRRIGNYCKAIGIEYLTVYAFSTENWRRPPEEVRTIMSIFDKYMKEALSIMERDKFKMRFFGERSGLSPELQRLMAAAEEKSTHYDGCQMNLCINYGGRDEILHAVRRYAEAYKAGTAPELTEDVFSGYLYSAGIPDPDLIIRTSGEQRLSNFLPWQGAYSELYFTDVLWPDFTERDMDAALAEFQRRDRRFGGVKWPLHPRERQTGGTNHEKQTDRCGHRHPGAAGRDLLHPDLGLGHRGGHHGVVLRLGAAAHGHAEVRAALCGVCRCVRRGHRARRGVRKV